MTVGDETCGAAVGVCGAAVGFDVCGAAVGFDVCGAAVGFEVGGAAVGYSVGTGIGAEVGCSVGAGIGDWEKVGLFVGERVGSSVHTSHVTGQLSYAVVPSYPVCQDAKPAGVWVGLSVRGRG